MTSLMPTNQEEDQQGDLLSTASIQNNIGVLMLLMGSIEEAAERFHLAIESVEPLGPNILFQNDPSHVTETNHPSQNENTAQKLQMPHKQRHKSATSYDGLVWFYQRLFRQVFGHPSAAGPSKTEVGPSYTRSTSVSHHHISAATTSAHPKRLIVEGAASKNNLLSHHIPLGLEYISEPIMVGPNTQDGRLAAYLNLTWIHLHFGSSMAAAATTTTSLGKNDSQLDSGVQTALQLLQRAKLPWTDTDTSSQQRSSYSLEIITHINLGVLFFSMGQLHDASLEFESALECLHNNTSIKSSMKSSIKSSMTCPTIVWDYLQITASCNMARTCIRNNQLQRAIQLCEGIEHCTIHTTAYQPFTHNSSLPTNVPFFNTARLPSRCKWISHSISKHYLYALIQHRQEHFSSALENINLFLSQCRVELGHSHVHVASALERKGAILFDQRNLHTAMLTYLAALRIYESSIKTVPKSGTHPYRFQIERARLLYAIGRSLHDREEYIDALSMYNKALEMQRELVQNELHQHQNASVDVITTLCNVGRIHHLLGDLDKALQVNKEVVNLAIDMVTESARSVSHQELNAATPESHDFVRNRMISLGNLYVEAGRLEEAMNLFTRIARSQGLDSMLSFRPEGSDIDTGSFAVRAAERLGKVGLQVPHAAAA